MHGPDRETFAARLGAAVEVEAPHGRVPLRVAHVEDYGDGDGTRFSVFLDGSAQQPLSQGTYEVRAGDEAFLLFLVPVAREGDRLSYEAAFNRRPGS